MGLSEKSKTWKTDFLQIIIIFAISIFLRIPFMNRDIFTDEAFSYLYSLKPISFIIKINDVHPPLYHLYLKPFSAILGNNIFLLRLSTLLLWICLFWAIYGLLMRLWNIKVAKYALLLISISPTMIYYSTELRMYAMGMLFVTLSFIALFNHLKKNNFKSSVYYAITILLMGLTHYLTFAVLPFQFAYIIYKRKHQNIIIPMSAAIFVVALALMSKLQYSSLHFVKPTLISLISSYSFMWSYPNKNLGLVLIPLAILLFMLLYYKIHITDEKALLFGSLYIVPILFFILSQFFVIYHHRFFLFEAVGLYIFIAYAIYQIRIKTKEHIYYAIIGMFIVAAIFTIGCESSFIKHNQYDYLENVTDTTIIANNTFDFFTYRFYTEGHNVSVLLNTTLNRRELFSYGGNVLNVSDFYTINGQKYAVAGYVLIV